MRTSVRPTGLLLMTMLAGTGCSLFASLDGLAGGDDALASPDEAADGGGTAQQTKPPEAAGPADAIAPNDASTPDSTAKDASAGPIPVCKSTGYKTGLDAKNVGTGTPWSEPQNSVVDDGKSAEALLTASSADSASLRIARFELGIPADATIRGVTVRVKRSASTAGIRDAEVRIGPTVQLPSANRQTTPIAWANETVLYGGSDDRWGLTPTAALLNADAFGVTVKARYTETAGNARARVDAVEIDVAYCQ